jgi:hypothetical protein
MILSVSNWLSSKISIEAKQLRISSFLTVLFAGFDLYLYLIRWIIKYLQSKYFINLIHFSNPIVH